MVHEPQLRSDGPSHDVLIHLPKPVWVSASTMTIQRILSHVVFCPQTSVRGTATGALNSMMTAEVQPSVVMLIMSVVAGITTLRNTVCRIGCQVVFALLTVQSMWRTAEDKGKRSS